MNLSSISLNQLPHLDLKPTHLKKLEKLGISNILDLLHYYPRDHVTYRVSKIAEARIGEAVTVVGKIQQHRIFTARNSKLTVQTWTIANKADLARPLPVPVSTTTSATRLTRGDRSNAAFIESAESSSSLAKSSRTTTAAARRSMLLKSKSLIWLVLLHPSRRVRFALFML
jgi:RecG wedge domain